MGYGWIVSTHLLSLLVGMFLLGYGVGPVPVWWHGVEASTLIRVEVSDGDGGPVHTFPVPLMSHISHYSLLAPTRSPSCLGVL